MYFADESEYALENDTGLLSDGSWLSGPYGPFCPTVHSIAPHDPKLTPVEDTSTHTYDQYLQALRLRGAMVVPIPSKELCQKMRTVIPFVTSMSQDALSKLTHRDGYPWKQALTPEFRRKFIKDGAVDVPAVVDSPAATPGSPGPFPGSVETTKYDSWPRIVQKDLKRHAQHHVRRYFYYLLTARNEALSHHGMGHDFVSCFLNVKYQCQYNYNIPINDFFRAVEDFMLSVDTNETAKVILDFFVARLHDGYIKWAGSPWKRILWSYLLTPAHFWDWDPPSAITASSPRYQAVLQEMVKHNPDDVIANTCLKRLRAVVHRIEDECMLQIQCLDPACEHEDCLPEREEKVLRGFHKKYLSGSQSDWASFEPFHRYALALICCRFSSSLGVLGTCGEQLLLVKPQHVRSELALTTINPKIFQFPDRAGDFARISLVWRVQVCRRAFVDLPPKQQAEKLVEAGHIAAAVKILCGMESELKEFFPSDAVFAEKILRSAEAGDRWSAPEQLLRFIADKIKTTDVAKEEYSKVFRPWLERLRLLGEPDACIQLAKLSFSCGEQEQAFSYWREAGPCRAMFAVSKLLGAPNAWEIFSSSYADSSLLVLGADENT